MFTEWNERRFLANFWVFLIKLNSKLKLEQKECFIAQTSFHKALKHLFLNFDKRWQGLETRQSGVSDAISRSNSAQKADAVIELRLDFFTAKLA